MIKDFLIRQAALQSLDSACARQCIIDSLTVLVATFYLAPSSRGDLREKRRARSAPSSCEDAIGTQTGRPVQGPTPSILST